MKYKNLTHKNPSAKNLIYKSKSAGLPSRKRGAVMSEEIEIRAPGGSKSIYQLIV